MKKLLLLLSLGILFISCSSNSPDIKEETPTVTVIKPIEIPFREHGYSEFPSKLITTQESLDTFLAQVGNVNAWNSKTDFLEKIQNENIDFTKYNLLFYRITETSGSVTVDVKNDAMRLVNNEVIITIAKSEPSMGTTDMAYYAVAYRVSKSLKSVVFDDGKQKVVIGNEKSDMIVPKNCQAWSDGCNNCLRGGGCTKRACLVYRPQNFKCTKWD